MSTGQQPARTTRRRWPRVVTMSLIIGGLVTAVVSATGNAQLPPVSKQEKKEKPESGKSDSLQRSLAGQLELMEEMLKILKNPKGPAPDDLFRLMEKMPKMLQAQLPPPPALPAWDPGRLVYIQARLGIRVESPSETLVEQLNLPPGRGQVIVQVVPGSPAAKARLTKFDILLELHGKPVAKGLAEFVRALEGIKPDVPVDAVVLRKGVRTQVKGLVLRNLPPLPPAPALPPALLPKLP